MNPSRPTYDTDAAHRVKRIASRATYDVDTVNAILDSGYVCHIGFVQDGTQSVMPMTYWRQHDAVLFHSAATGRFAQACRSGDVCFTVTLFDGLVLGHSPINHSVNYRSVIVRGRPEAIDDTYEKLDAMRDFFAKTLPGRWEDLRTLTDEELASLTVFRLPLRDVSAKIRNEYTDTEEHMPASPPWVGIVPAHLAFEPSVPDPRFPTVALPAYLAGFSGKLSYADRVDRKTGEAQ